MPTVNDIANEVLQSIDCSANLGSAERWVGRRYQALCGKTRFRHLRHVGELIVPKLLQVGSCTVQQGSKEVLGDADAVAAWVAKQGIIPGAYFKVYPQATWYRIVGVTENKLILDSPYSSLPQDPNPLANTGYSIAWRIFRLNHDVRHEGVFVFPRLRRRLSRLSLQGLMSASPDRFRQLGGPMVVADAGVDRVTKQRLVELYPYSEQDELVAYCYWRIPPLLDAMETVPTVIDADILREGALIDAMRYEAAKAARAGDMNGAAYWRNEYRAQETKWREMDIPRAVKADRGEDDLTFILRGYGDGAGVSDITNAREQVLATQNWPV